MAKKEFKVGEVFQCGLVKLKVEKVKGNNHLCNGCFFNNSMHECENNKYFIGSCSSKGREDKNNVIFVKVED